MKPETPQDHFNHLYSDISRSFADASEELARLRVDHVDGRQAIGGIRERLEEIRRGFDEELALLQQNAEWDRLTIAFFGETNAGKSTVLEALRILFSEEGRQSILQANDNDLALYEETLQTQIESVRAALHAAIQSHSERLIGMKRDAEALTAIVQAESSARVRMRHWVFAISGAVLGSIATFAALKGLAVP